MRLPARRNRMRADTIERSDSIKWMKWALWSGDVIDRLTVASPP